MTMSVDNLWYLASEASQRAEQVFHDLDTSHDGYVEYDTGRSVSRPRFRTVANRIKAQGLPYGAHTLAYRPSGQLLLVWHEMVDQWVLPGGEIDDGESFREGARRELNEEAGIDASLDGLAILGRVRFHCDGHETWGVLPIYEAPAQETDLSVEDPDGEITDAQWFDELPENTRDRAVLREWRDRALTS
jgi:8-oxo-dGTP diphosphatase